MCAVPSFFELKTFKCMCVCVWKVCTLQSAQYCVVGFDQCVVWGSGSSVNSSLSCAGAFKQCSAVWCSVFSTMCCICASQERAQWCLVGLALIGALTWSQPDRDLTGGQSSNPFQIGRYLYSLDFNFIFLSLFKQSLPNWNMFIYTQLQLHWQLATKTKWPWDKMLDTIWSCM